MNQTKSVLLVGVGGQGAILVAKRLAMMSKCPKSTA